MKPISGPDGEFLPGVSFYQYIGAGKINREFDVIIIGGSYAGLSAALVLARCSRRVLLIDSGNPCNSKSLIARNFIGHDGEPIATITKAAKSQLLKYAAVKVIYDKVLRVKNVASKFVAETMLNETYRAKKILLATGVTDQMLAIPGFKDCWGISVFSSPYDHAYEYHDKTVGVIANGVIAYELIKLLSNQTKRLVLFTNAESSLTGEQSLKIVSHNISIVQKKIAGFDHEQGMIKNIVFKDNSRHKLNVAFTHVPFQLSTDIPCKQLGCELTTGGLVKTDEFQRTSVQGVYAAGDIESATRAITIAAARGSLAGIHLNIELNQEGF
jgi:thioredoxin reductase